MKLYVILWFYDVRNMIVQYVFRISQPSRLDLKQLLEFFKMVISEASA